MDEGKEVLVVGWGEVGRGMESLVVFCRGLEFLFLIFIFVYYIFFYYEVFFLSNRLGIRCLGFGVT